MLAIEIIFMVILLGGCFFFAMSEASIVAANPNVLKKLSITGDRRANSAFKLISNRKILFGTTLLGTNIAIVGFSTLGETMMSNSLGPQAEGPLWLIISILIFDGLVLILGEIVPKSIALEAPEKRALTLAPVIELIGKFLKPVIELVHYIPSLVLKGMNPEDADRKLITENQIKLAFIQGSRAGTVEEEEKDFGLKVIDFAETNVERVMTLRGDIVSLPAEITVREAYDRVRDHGYSRIPIYIDDEENITGFLNVKDLIKAYILNEHDKKLTEIKWDITFIPEKKKVLDLMLDFQREHRHIAMVVDEAGNITGLVTLEDLLEEVVGEIYDEHDEPEEIIQKLTSDTYLVDGKLSVEDLNETLNLELDEEQYDTVAGFVMGLFGRVPEEGLSIQHSGIKFTIVKMDHRQIDQIKLKIGSRFTPPKP